MGQAEIVVDMVQNELLAQADLTLAQRGHPSPHRGDMLADAQVDAVTVDRRITPPTAVPERSVRLSPHAAPQYPDAGHAYQAGDSLGAPAFSRRGNVHEALADWQSANRVGHRWCDRSRSGRHVGRTAHNSDSVLVVL